MKYTKSQILTIVFVLVFIISIIMTFYKYIIREDIVYETDEEAFQQALLEE